MKYVRKLRDSAVWALYVWALFGFPLGPRSLWTLWEANCELKGAG